MKNKNFDMLCFSSIDLSEPEIIGKSVKTSVMLNKLDGSKKEFFIKLKYDDEIKDEYLQLLRLAFCIPLLNYGLFSKQFKLDFPIRKSDIELLNELNQIFSKDIFVNKILRRKANYILPEYLPKEEDVKPGDANPKAEIKPTKIYSDEIISDKMNKNNCGVLSSGGKESLLTYGMLKEIGCNVYPLYINESGGHWRTAIPAYRYHKRKEPNTKRVWTNIDRFYNFMLDNLMFIRPDHRKVWADTYPIRLCIFPFYVFSLLPIYADNKIGNLLIGSEFDDLRSKPMDNGIVHYYGIYDQHQDYDILMNRWYEKRMPGLIQWSALRNISGLIVERILFSRYLELVKNQRSCHSCHFEKNEIVPCGRCSKCMGILLFLLANHADPKIMNFKEKDIICFSNRVTPSNLRLDQDEKDQSFYLIGKKGNIPNIQPIEHVEKIHLKSDTCNLDLIPDNLRHKILNIIEQYTNGYCEMRGDKWISIKEVKI